MLSKKEWRKECYALAKDMDELIYETSQKETALSLALEDERAQRGIEILERDARIVQLLVDNSYLCERTLSQADSIRTYQKEREVVLSAVGPVKSFGKEVVASAPTSDPWLGLGKKIRWDGPRWLP